MSIKDVMVSALRRIGREELAADVEDGGKPTGEGGEVVKTLLYCINATEDELARHYFPLKFTESFKSVSGIYDFSNFSFTPVKILEVKAGGKEAGYKLFPNYLEAEAAEVEITYLYAPSKKELGQESEFGALADGNLTSLGAAAEYCLICGETAMAEVWEARYRAAIDRAQKERRSTVYVPPRRWV